MKVINRLDDFQSHSIHYVMLACRSTEDVRIFTDDSEKALSQSLLAIDNAPYLGEVVSTDKNGSAYLLMDTRRFSQFTIENFSLETYVSGFTVPGSMSPHNTAVNMSFTVIDNIGISFANFLQYLMDQKLQVSFDGMTILVRLLFVGHRSDGSTETIQTVTIPAIFNQIQMDLNDVKGSYACTAFPLSAMPSTRGFNAKWTTIGNATSFFSGKGINNLGSVINAFEASLNAESVKRYSQLNAVLQENTEQVGHFGRPVQYMITIPESWERFNFNGPSQGAAVEINFSDLLKQKDDTVKTIAAPAKDSYVSVTPDMQITDVLDKIFSQVIDISKLGNFSENQKTSSMKFFKHIVTVTSNDDSFTVHIDVVEFLIPNINETKNISSNDDFLRTVTDENGTRKVPKNYLEYDYIYSGTNTDVLSLDLKIENLNWMLMQGTKLGAGELFDTSLKGQEQQDGEGVSTDSRVVFGMKAKDPFLMPKLTKGQRENFSNYAANAQVNGKLTPQQINQQYVRNLSAFYNAGPITAKMEIRGNPDLMVHMTPSHLPPHVSAYTITDINTTSNINSNVKLEYRKSFEAALAAANNLTQVDNGAFTVSQALSGPSFLTSPVFLKVNVFGPNVNWLNNEPLQFRDFAQRLMYDNYYYLSKITSKIEHSKFTQELELLSYSVYGYSTVTANNKSKVKDI